MNNLEKVTLRNNDKQPVKMVNYQDLFATSELLNQLISWHKPLNFLKEFFSDGSYPVNKKKIIIEYHACSQIFNVFLEDFIKSVGLMEAQINELKRREKLQ